MGQNRGKNSAVLTLSAIAIIVIAVAALVIYYNSKVQYTTITTQGVADEKVMPDEVVIYFSATATNDSASAARDKVGKINDDLMTALVKLGIERKDIESGQYSISPNYVWDVEAQTQKTRGYMATQQIKVTTKDIDNAGKYIDAGVDAGALVSYVNFELNTSNQNAVKARLLAAAATDARVKADSIASGLGKAVFDIESVTTSDYNYYPIRAYDMAVSSSEGKSVPATDLVPQQLEISAQVQVVFKIK